MKAITHTRYGPPSVLQLTDLDKPSPQPGQVLIQNHASAVSSGDAKVRGYRDIPLFFWLPGRLMMGITKPRKAVPGCDFAGVVEAVGDGVTEFKPGDRVFGTAEFSLGIGTAAEYICLPDTAAIVKIPADLLFQQAVALPFGSLCARYFLAKADLAAGQKIMIVGASGAVGTAAVQLAKHTGAHVTGVCSGKNAELVQSLGADRVIDYTQESYLNTGDTYDVVFDTVAKLKWKHVKPALTPTGRFAQLVFGGFGILEMLLRNPISKQKIVRTVSDDKKEDLQALAQLVEAGHLKPVIDSVYPLQQTAAAHTHVETGRKVGAVVIGIEH